MALLSAKSSDETCVAKLEAKQLTWESVSACIDRVENIQRI